MKFIHTADIHLGAKMDSKFTKEISLKRREEIRNTFKRMVSYAIDNGVRAIILAGDVFDSDRPTIKDKEFFYTLIENTPQIDFIYLRGNHDVATYAEKSLPNLKTFNNGWTSYEYGDTVISGIEISSENCSSMYSTLLLPPDKLNIVTLHGQAGDAVGKDRVCLKRLRDKNIDYLALGHVHKPLCAKLDDRGEYAYCGCLEGRGFDETGEHGFVLLETGAKITRKFVPFAERVILERDADISGEKNAYSAYLKVKRLVDPDDKNIYRINLVGEIDDGVEISSKAVAEYLARDCFFADVKDRTRKKLDFSRFEGDLSLRGEFVRTVFSDPEISDEQKRRIVLLGLKALEGGEIEL